MGKCLRHRRWVLVTALALLASCQSFPLFTGTHDTVKADKDAGMPSKYSFRVSQFVFYSDFDLNKNQAVFKDLSTLRETVYKDLQLPPSDRLIQVCLFEDKAKYETYMKAKYQNLPMRRAFFVAQPRRIGGLEDLYVYTWWSDRVQQDLRHELTHAMLHSTLKDVPLWLDEGLAEYYEMPPAWNGVNYQHIDVLRGPTVKFDLDRLEKLKDVKDMTPTEYREAWAWTHLMLRTTPDAKKALLGYLHELRTNAQPGSIRPRLEKAYQTPDDAVRRHLADLDLSKPKGAATVAN